jgi:hypothetical protein
MEIRMRRMISASRKTEMAFRMRLASSLQTPFIIQNPASKIQNPFLFFVSSCEAIYLMLQQNAEKLSTCPRVLAGQPGEGSPQGDMSGIEGGNTGKLKGVKAKS